MTELFCTPAHHFRTSSFSKLTKTRLVDKNMPLLPREGITLETILQILSKTALQPLLTGPLLYATTLDILQPLLAAHKKDALVKVLRVLLTIGILKSANNTLSKLVMNNWTADNWRKGEEIVLITGGGSGIGELMARDLAPWSKAVVVLDLTPPKMSLRKMLITVNFTPGARS